MFEQGRVLPNTHTLQTNTRRDAMITTDLTLVFNQRSRLSDAAACCAVARCCCVKCSKKDVYCQTHTPHKQPNKQPNKRRENGTRQQLTDYHLSINALAPFECTQDTQSVTSPFLSTSSLGVSGELRYGRLLALLSS